MSTDTTIQRACTNYGNGCSVSRWPTLHAFLTGKPLTERERLIAERDEARAKHRKSNELHRKVIDATHADLERAVRG